MGGASARHGLIAGALFAYRSIPGLSEYVLVDPDQRRVEVYRYASGGTHEVITEGSVRLDCIDAVIALDDIYVDAERSD